MNLLDYLDKLMTQETTYEDSEEYGEDLDTYDLDDVQKPAPVEEAIPDIIMDTYDVPVVTGEELPQAFPVDISDDTNGMPLESPTEKKRNPVIKTGDPALDAMLLKKQLQKGAEFKKEELEYWEKAHPPIDNSDPVEFVRTIRPWADAVEKDLGIPSNVVIAQIAQETGWGKTVRGNNFFNIKKGKGWEGDTTDLNALEYDESGKKINELSKFRAYDSPEGSFKDYIKFLRSNPRYSEALKNTNDPEKFLTELQKAGYATDPDYAKNVMNVLKWVKRRRDRIESKEYNN